MSRTRISPHMWIRERLDNCQRIAATKPEADRAGWLEDAAQFAAVLEIMAKAEGHATAEHPLTREGHHPNPLQSKGISAESTLLPTTPLTREVVEAARAFIAASNSGRSFEAVVKARNLAEDRLSRALSALEGKVGS